VVAPLDEAGLMSVAAIVVNFNGGETLGRCVSALFSSSVKPQVHVIDNASTDGSAQRLNQLYGNRAGMEVLFNPGNIGFAAAVNRAMERIEAQWVLILNPDCIIAPNTLSKLKQALDDDAHAALAAPAVTGRDGRLERSTLRRFPNPWNSLLTILGLWRLGRWVPRLQGIPVAARQSGPDPVVAEAVSGACMLVRRQVFVEIGGFDEGYGLHCEDLDLMYRLAQAGWHCLYVPAAEAMHEQGVSSRSRPLWVHRQKHRGMRRFFDKFQASQHGFLFRLLVRFGIGLHYLVSLPAAWLRR
jgi:GT2 family glycosyltransferase